MSPLQTIAADQLPPQPWRNGGGQTRELLVWPDVAHWQLRISRADIAANGPFSAYPGVQRWFAVLSGKGLVLHMPTPDGHTRDHHLCPGHMPLHFDGALAPGCTLEDGPSQDLNLMARGGQACMLLAEADQAWSPSYAMAGLYTSGSGVWSDGQQSVELPAHTLLWQTASAHGASPASVPLPSAACPPAASPVIWHFSPHAADLPAFWLGYTPEARA